jgi:L-threonylcarbamoyladenylate synthase
MSGSNPSRQGQVRAVDALAIADAATQLRAGGIVGIPTETVYGLAADANNADAVAKIYTAKGRPDFNPLIVHVPDRAAAEELADFGPLAVLLAEAFWPGPLTLVLPLKPGAPVAAAVTAGLPTIAIRCPAHPVMQSVLLASGLNVAAPSANKSGGISPTRAQHVAASLGAALTLILDGGPCRAGLESTIVAVRPHGWQILRPGPVTAAELEVLIGHRPLNDALGIEAPGQLASHYASADEWHIGFGAIAGDDNLSTTRNLAQAAARLFEALHIADASDRMAIAIAPIPVHGIGEAMNDRLNRAAAR